MTELAGLFEPDRVAVVGASPRVGSIGWHLTTNLLDSFDGTVVPVNPNHDEILGRSCVPTVAQAGQIDLAVVAVPAVSVPDVLREVGESGIDTAVVISAGFAETGERGAALERELVSVSREYGLTLVGPNSLGVISTANGLNATFAQSNALEGSISMLSQSGAFVTAALDWATDRGLGFRDVVSVGNAAVVDETDFIEHWGDDQGTDVIIGYLEEIDDGRGFVDRVRRVTPDTPVVLLKAGRSAAGARAAASHTGSMAGSDRAYAAGFREAGVIRVDTVEALFDAASTLSGLPIPGGNDVAVVTNTGGAGVLASDALADTRLQFAAFSDETEAVLSESLPAAASIGNPLDILGDADVDRFQRTLDTVLTDAAVDAVALLSAPTAIFEFEELADAALETWADHDVPMVAGFMGGDRVESAASTLRAAGVPNYFDPARAIRSLNALRAYRDVRGGMSGDPLEYDMDEEHIDALLDRAASRGGRLGVESMEFLSAVGIPTPAGELASSPGEAVDIADRIGGPVVMKIASPDVSHKSDLGGVEIGVSLADVEGTYEAIVDRVAGHDAEADIDGVYVESMVDVDAGVETIVGANRDPQFGPLVVFGLGGIFVEVFEDVAFRLAPVTREAAEEMTGEIDAAGMLRGARGREPVNLDGVVQSIGRIAHLVDRFPRIRELDVNPLLATADGVTALDFRLVVDADGDRAD